MTCRAALEFLADYLEGKLPVRQRLMFRLHLILCRHCRNYLDSYGTTILATREALGNQAPGEGLPEDLIQAILAARIQDPSSN